MMDTKFLSDVIKYDRYQPEFYEDTNTYISKKHHQKKFDRKILWENSKLINSVQNKFNVEKGLFNGYRN